MNVHILSGFLLLISCLILIDAQRMNCRMFRKRCEDCTRRLNDPKNEMGIFNDKCRRKLRNSVEWRNLNRCDLQYIACRANHERLDCRDIAILTKMRKFERNKQRRKHIPRFAEDVLL